MTDQLDNIKRVVIKIGSALLVDGDNGELRADWLSSVIQDVAILRQQGKDVIIVSSGSIALGRKRLGLSMGKKLDVNQAAAALGQIELAAAYRNRLNDHDLDAAQILLTYEDTEVRRRYLNARNTITRLLKMGVVPVINENDTVATDEVRFGDNDRLAARVAVMCEADCLFLLSDINGLYTADPNKNSDAEFISQVSEITSEIEDMAGDPVSTGFGSGGMITKLKAAKIATASGCHMVILNGTEKHPVKSYMDQGLGTWFSAAQTPLQAKKKWIRGTLHTAGRVHIDAGAEAALRKGRSLLPIGMVKVEGTFERGDSISVINHMGDEIARGLTAYNNQDAEKLIGQQSQDIEQCLGYGGRDEIIHRSDLVML